MFHDMIADAETNKKLSPINTELFLRGKKTQYSIFFNITTLIKVSKTITLKAVHYFIMKIPNK